MLKILPIFLIAPILLACGGLESARETGKNVTGALVDRYCEAAPGEAREEIRSRLRAYLDDRIITEINCDLPE